MTHLPSRMSWPAYVFPPTAQDRRPSPADRESHKQCNTLERCINRLKQWRGIATRYEKTATIHLAALHIAPLAVPMIQTRAPSTSDPSIEAAWDGSESEEGEGSVWLVLAPGSRDRTTPLSPHR